MTNRRFYEIDVAVAFNGATCKDLDVQFEKPTECANIRCEYSEGKILVEIPTDCSECVYAVVTCNDDDCAVCNEPERIKICPCNSSADCPDCEECINNMCVSSCTEGQFCSSDGICADCDDTVPCPKNQVCVAGKCECPPDKPIKNSKGECVACDDNNPCPPCTYCTPTGCKPIVCPEGVCDPDTGKCVECNGSGDCDGDNECCVNNKCDCCKGFKRDYATGKCIPDDDCKNDGDCEECEICYKGKCIPRECPEGYICVGDDCVPECDCADATCGKYDACVAAGANRCYCKPCEGACSDNNDCGEGCICKDGNCVPNPCKGGCANGTDCGEGCGCDETGNCVPCDSYSCANSDCSNILGCGCLGTGCTDVGGCSGSCSSSYDCGEGCTCYQGECVPCADFPCTNNECSDQPGCACTNGKCGGDGGGGDGDDGCGDTFTITKDDANCDLIATLSKEESCSCPKLTIDNKLSGVSMNADDFLLDILVELRKGSVGSVSAVNTIPLLGDANDENIADNEKPSSGVVEIFVTTTYREVDEDGLFVGFTTGPVKKYSASMVDKDSHTFSGVIVQSIGKQVSDFLFVHKVEVEVRQATDLKFPNNCVYYGPKTVDNFTITKNDDLDDIFGGNNLKKLKFAGFVTITSLSDRYPMLTWYRSTDGTYSSNEAIRKIYVPSVGGTSTDTLFGLAEIPDGKYPLETPEGELWSGRYYSVKNDCSCEKEADSGKVVFCNPNELFYDLDSCNKEITLLEPFLPCDVNQDITQFETANYDIPNDVQTKYKFYLNGNLVETFVHNKNLGMIKDGTADSMFGKYTISEPITEIKLVMNHDTSNECTLIYTVPQVDDIDIAKTINCGITGSNYQVTVPKVGASYTITGITSTHGTVVNGTGSFVLTLPKATSVTLVYELASGCSITEVINEDCCDDFSVTLNASTDGCGGDVGLTFTPVGGQSPYTATYLFPDGTSTTVTGTSAVVDSSPISGTYSVSVTDANGCRAGATQNVTVNPVPVVTFSGYNDICAGDSTAINIETDAAGVGGVIHYTANGVASSLTVAANGTASITPINTAGEYVFTKIVVNGCEFTLGEVINIDIIPDVNITMTLDPVGGVACRNSTVDFNLAGGIEGCQVELVSGGSVLRTSTFDASGDATLSITAVSTASYTIRLKSTCTATCVSGLPLSQTITVVDGPTITLTDESCDDTLTNKTLTFDNIDSAVDQNGTAILVIGNTITFDPNIVTAVTVTYNNGTCTTVKSFNVSPCACPEVTITLDNQTINNGESAVLTPVISGGSGSYSYSWSNGETTSSIAVGPTTTTSYTLTLTDNTNGCIYTATATIIVVNCSGGLSAMEYDDACVCTGAGIDCALTFTPIFLESYLSCKINEELSDIQYYLDGSATGTTVDVSNANNLTLTVTLDGSSGCPNPTTIRFAGTIVFLDETGDSCCDGTSIDFDTTVSRPALGWNCAGC